MLSFTGSLKVYLATEPVDLRKSFNGLYALTANVLKESPENGALFVFTNKRRNRVKILNFDGTGLWVMIHSPTVHPTGSLPRFTSAHGGEKGFPFGQGFHTATDCGKRKR